ncbi:phage protein Gp36 family protein [Polaromonas sp. UC242_47]|uniref:phage protein Gp36 family protein n=1 Tax=Polaromonas sp. UC242_47 TaxID=3374626 RepID=UPI0037B2B68C
MPYATPQQVIQAYGLKEVTQLLADEQDLLTEQLLTDAIAEVWTGAPSQEEKDAATGALARFVRKIETSSSFMDGYLRNAVTLPLSADDVNIGTLNECCMALVRCSLSDDPDNATERMDDCCNTWRAWLKDVSRGTVQLVNPAGETLPGKSRIRFGPAASSYNWAAHKVAR